MILAAGFGTRLKPYTDSRPKPLFPLLNIPLLLLTINRLQHAGFDCIIINCHHLSEQIRVAVQDIPGVVLQEEQEILGTGGGLRHAYEKMCHEPLLITNGDIYHSIDFTEIYQYHCDTGNRITLAVHDCPRFNSLLIDGERLVSFAGKGDPRALAFTGIHVIDPEILTPLPIGRQRCIVERYKELLVDNADIGVLRVDDQYWTDMGTPADYLALHGGILKGCLPCWQEIGQGIHSSFLIAREARIGGELCTYDWACIGRARIGSNVHVERSVIWDGAVIPDNTRIVDRIVTSPEGWN